MNLKPIIPFFWALFRIPQLQR